MLAPDDWQRKSVARGVRRIRRPRDGDYSSREKYRDSSWDELDRDQASMETTTN